MYDLIGFVNDNPPAINAANLNKMDNKLLDLDNKAVSYDNVLTQLLQKKELEFEVGTITNSGEDASNNKVVRTDYYQFYGYKIKLSVKAATGLNPYVRVFAYDQNKTYYWRSSYAVGDYVIEINPNHYYRFICYDGSVPNVAVTVDTVQQYYEIDTVQDFTPDETLSKKGVYPDSKVVGDTITNTVNTVVSTEVEETREWFTWTPYEIDYGVLLEDGTIDTSFHNLTIGKYRNVAGKKLYLNGIGTYTPGHNFCYLWFVKNGNMKSYIPVDSNPQTFDHVLLNIDSDVDEIWIEQLELSILQKSSVDLTARKIIHEQRMFGAQWDNKVWYAYGTSITSVHQGTGKYPTYLAAMSGMQLNEKGYGGGGIGDLGAYSRGQVYDMIHDLTDGKLNADLITLEQGANDVTKDVPLGTIYDTGQTTLAGCLNDCLRYLQEKTNAQIAVIPSVDARFTDNDDWIAYNNWFLMMAEICRINRVHFINNDNNMGYGKLHSNKRQLYIVDNIHQTDLGGYIMAENIWYQLRNIPLFYTEIPQ